jgi:hypothetical protein
MTYKRAPCISYPEKRLRGVDFEYIDAILIPTHFRQYFDPWKPDPQGGVGNEKRKKKTFDHTTTCQKTRLQSRLKV